MKTIQPVYPHVTEVFKDYGKLALADFAKRGMHPETALSCGIQDCLVQYLTPPQQDPSNRSPLAGSRTQWIRLPQEHRTLRIPYFRAGDSGGLEIYSRFRFLEELPQVWDSKKHKWKPTRYLGRAKEVAKRLYVCPLLLEKWPGILRDPSEPLMVTEGELKSIVCTQHGYPTIAISGVWMGTEGREAPVSVFGRPSREAYVPVRSRRDEKSFRLIPDFEWVNLKGRTVVIVFDSDREDKWQLRAAERRLTGALEKAGAAVRITELTPQEVVSHV